MTTATPLTNGHTAASQLKVNANAATASTAKPTDHLAPQSPQSPACPSPNGSSEFPTQTPQITRKSSMEMASSTAANIERLHDAWFKLEDGTVLAGYSFGSKAAACSGEVVFNTGMVGYPESLTDPSYRGQILILTYPLIGNYGVPSMTELDELGLPAHFESNSVQVTALVCSSYSHFPSHYTSNSSLSAWLQQHKIPAICGVDTRALTKKIREHGSLLGKIVFSEQQLNDVVFPMQNPNARNLVAEVSRREPCTYGRGRIKILAIDCGIKFNIIRQLVRKGVELKVVPHDYDIEEENYDGLFISNGPGDPSMCEGTIRRLKKIFESDLQNSDSKPIFGICLGSQLMALAAGAKTYKMKFGNRGMNQPCIDMRTTLCCEFHL